MPTPGLIAVIIEDDPLVLRALEVYLETLGFLVISVADPRQFLKEVPGMKCRIDLLITTSRPDNATPYEDLVGAVRRNFGDVPSIVLTGDTSAPARQRAQAAGCHYISKPVSPKALSDVIQALTDRHASDPSDNS
ncbi:response regulator [Azospirillum sp. TSO22-1]|uniref:response regulator n=1 Tax=Azospirillum sp. TSO22-1 TaxID=716789 RepID=UPI000D606C08|nr:response regulator [Azospirillum sp. TSO22-1]PWC52487.1 hypothetical protein TSO221_14015 [Azospirillum sp. TSO22-1]